MKENALENRNDPFSLNCERADWAILAGILILATILRVWRIRLGLPYLYHPDEHFLVEFAQNMLRTGDLNPHWFLYPSLYFYFQALVYLPCVQMMHWAGSPVTLGTIPFPDVLAMGTGHTTMPEIFLAGRLLTAFFGTITVPFVYFIGKRLANNSTVGAMSALLFAVSPTNVANCLYTTPTACMIFFVVLSFWASVKIFQEGRTKYYVLAACAAGLAASVKYNGGMILLSLLAAVFFHYGWKGVRERRFWAILALFLLVFLVTTPYSLLDHSTFIKDLGLGKTNYSGHHAGLEGDSMKWYLTYLWGVEGPASLFAAFEIFRSLRKYDRGSLLLATFPIAYLAFVSRFNVRTNQTLLPVTPFVFILGCIFIVRIIGYFSEGNHLTVRHRFVQLASLVVLIAFPSYKTVTDIAAPDNREAARIWANENLPAGAQVAIESYAPYVDPQRFKIREFARMTEQQPNWYAANGFDFLIFCEAMYGRFYRDPARYPEEIVNYEGFFRSLKEVRTFDSHVTEYRIHQGGGYAVRIYQMVYP